MTYKPVQIKPSEVEVGGLYWYECGNVPCWVLILQKPHIGTLCLMMGRYANPHNTIDNLTFCAGPIFEFVNDEN
jgi:hypothetical protein